MSSMNHRKWPQTNSSKIDSKKRLLLTAAPMLRERYSRRQNQTDGYYHSSSNQESTSSLVAITEQPHQGSSIQDQYLHQNTSSPSAAIFRPLKSTKSVIDYKSTLATTAEYSAPATSERNNNQTCAQTKSFDSYRFDSSRINSAKLDQSALSDEISLRQTSDPLSCGAICGEQNNLSLSDRRLVDKIKSKLSLSRDTSIPRGFILKLKFKHFQPLKDDDLADTDEKAEKHIDDELNSLSRLGRQQSLAEIGFGKSSTYVKSHVLGAGTYSVVYKGHSRLTRKLVALKEIHLERDEGVPFTAIREVSLLKQLKHCNIITLHDIISTPKTLTLVFEFVDRDLSRYMDKCDHTINPHNVRLFLFQLLRALWYCHSKKILHRDLKPQNILINAFGELKLADFGLARANSIPTKTFTDEVVTLWYRPPDVLLGNTDYGTSIDMWGVGCIFFEMIAGYTLFTGTDAVRQLECIFEIVGNPARRDWPFMKKDIRDSLMSMPNQVGRDLANLAPRLELRGVDLMSKLLKCNPNSRISSQDAIRHEYFAYSLPREVYELGDSDSIFIIPDIELVEEDFSMNDPTMNLPHDISVQSGSLAC